MEQGTPIQVIYHSSAGELTMPSHFHFSHELIFVAQGRARFTVAGRRYEAGPGCLVLINHFEHHALEALEYPYARYYVLIRPERLSAAVGSPVLESVFRHRPAGFRHMVALGGETRAAVQKLIERMYLEYADRPDFWDASLQSLTRLLLIRLYRSCPASFPAAQNTDAARLVLRVQKYLDAHFCEAPALADVAGAFYISRCHLSRLFKSVTGFGFKEYLDLLRLARAKELLFYSQQSVTRVAAACGFGSVSQFIRVFREKEGVTPLQYRKKAAAETAMPAEGERPAAE
jgi:AraC-like DNA-binding protein